MSTATKRVVKMGLWFALFFCPFLWCVVHVIIGAFQVLLIEDSVYHQLSEPIGFILIFTGLGAVLFGRELYEAVHYWRFIHGSHRRRNERSNEDRA